MLKGTESATAHGYGNRYEKKEMHQRDVKNWNMYSLLNNDSKFPTLKDIQKASGKDHTATSQCFQKISDFSRRNNRMG